VPRPRSEDRRQAILAAATRVLATQGLGAATATIAKEAGVSNGSLFLYFESKPLLLNQLFVDLKCGMATAAVAGLPPGAPPREQIRHLWDGWLRWATTHPEKRRALAHLGVAEEITADSHHAVAVAFGDLAALLDRSRAEGPLRDAPLDFVLALITAIAETTIDAVLRAPATTAQRSAEAFDAIWRVLAGTSH
jgi:AcrR family transcriptional regulator